MLNNNLVNLQKSIIYTLNLVPSRNPINDRLLYTIIKSVNPTISSFDYNKSINTLLSNNIIKISRTNKISFFNPKIKEVYSTKNQFKLLPYIDFIFELNLYNKKVFNSTIHIINNILSNYKHLFNNNIDQYNQYLNITIKFSNFHKNKLINKFIQTNPIIKSDLIGFDNMEDNKSDFSNLISPDLLMNNQLQYAIF